MSRSARSRLTAVGIAGGIVAFDQLTKAWALAALDDGPIRLIGDSLRFELARNSGAAFGLFRGFGGIIALIALGTAVVLFLTVGSMDHPVDIAALGLVLGGTLGNLSDRVFRGDGWFDGEVIDFIANPVVPNFNVADAAITIGVALVLLGALRRG